MILRTWPPVTVTLSPKLSLRGCGRTMVWASPADSSKFRQIVANHFVKAERAHFHVLWCTVNRCWSRFTRRRFSVLVAGRFWCRAVTSTDSRILAVWTCKSTLFAQILDRRAVMAWWCRRECFLSIERYQTQFSRSMNFLTLKPHAQSIKCVFLHNSNDFVFLCFCLDFVDCQRTKFIFYGW